MPHASSLASTLPAEILTHILRLAQEGRAAPEQFNARLRFERVCRAWYESDFKWRVVAVNGLDNISKLVEMLDESKLSTALENLRSVAVGEDAVEDVASRIKSLHVTVPYRAELGGSEVVASLMELAVKVESIALAEDHAIERSGRSDCLRDAVLLALGNLTKVKHFTIAVLPPDADHQDCPLPASELFKFAGNWSKLETITYTHCALVARDMRTNSITTPTFHSLVLDRSDVYEESNQRHSLVSVLPRHTRELTINSRQWREADALRVPSLTSEGALEMARQIKELTITDEPDCDPAERAFVPASDRGKLDNFVADFENLTKLTITPLALGDMSTLATHHSKLKELKLALAYAVPQPELGSDELVRLLIESRSLKRIELDKELTKAWAAWENGLVEDTAEGRVEFSWF